MPLWVYKCPGCGQKTAALANSYVAHCCPQKNGKATIYVPQEEPPRILVGEPTRRDDAGVGGGHGAPEEPTGPSEG